MSGERKYKKEEIEVVTGDSSDLDFSAVYEHEISETTDSNEEIKSNKKIIIPKGPSSKK